MAVGHSASRKSSNYGSGLYWNLQMHKIWIHRIYEERDMDIQKVLEAGENINRILGLP